MGNADSKRQIGAYMGSSKKRNRSKEKFILQPLQKQLGFEKEATVMTETTEPHVVNGPDTDGRKEDLLIISNWVRKELFIYVKFLYRPEEDLAVNGQIYKKFRHDCKDRLVGLKLAARKSQDYRENYVKSLWSDATRKKCNLVSNGLNARRSSIYSATQNRFSDLCKLCATTNQVFPSLESFEEGINMPLVYMIFYEYFFKSSVGDSVWKKACLEAKDPTEPLAAPQEEAFAMILLRNNYFAWLWEAKMEFRELLVTEYDPKKEREFKYEDLGYGILNVRLDLDVDVDEEDMDKILVQFSVGGAGASSPVYERIHKEDLRKLKKVWDKAGKNTKYKELKKAWAMENEASNNVEEPIDQENEPTLDIGTKKRKRLRSFREYTCANDEEGRFKGWSVRAADDMAAIIAKLDSQDAKYKVFRRAYRATYQNKLTDSGKKKKPIQLQVPVNYPRNVWGLADIPDVEV